MTDTELIAQQARRIAELKQQVDHHAEDKKQALLILICVGGPLNDNKLGYTRAQLTPLARIARLLED